MPPADKYIARTASRRRSLRDARRIAKAYRTWGKGAHPASLNFGDCFAYEVAREHDAGCYSWAMNSLGPLGPI
jgi:uncharacterized protein with PIN domain